MKKTIIAAVLATAFAAAPALADCTADLAKIDEAMKSATLDEANKAKATDLLAKAKTAADAQDEVACSASAKEVLTMLGM
jgi:hypothetical protein